MAGLSQGGIFIVLNGSWSTKLIKYHGLKAFSHQQLNKSIILVVLLCPLYSIVYAIFEKHKIIKMAFVSICQHPGPGPAHAWAIHIFCCLKAESVELKLELQTVISTLSSIFSNLKCLKATKSKSNGSTLPSKPSSANKAVYRIVPVPARLTCKIFQLSGGMQNNFSSKMEQ